MDAMAAGQNLLEKRRQEITRRPTTRSPGTGNCFAPRVAPESPEVSASPVQHGDMCSVCRGIGWLRVDAQPGEPGFGRMVPCKCNQAVREVRRVKLRRITGMTDQELAVRLDDLIERAEDTAAMKAAAGRMIEAPWGILTLWGGAGNGKTLALQAVVNELRARRGMDVAYLRFTDLIDWLRDGFSDDSERARYEFIRSVPVLALDEVDKARMTEYADEFRFKFLDDRYRLALSGEAVTILAMNCNPRELPYYVFSRLNDGRFEIVHNADSDFRPVMERGD
jgi:DNA replication protein DnaC